MSVALEEWRGASARALDEIDSLYRLVEETSPSAPALNRQIAYAYAALTVAHFQRYCRAVHTEAVDALVAVVPAPAALARALGGAMVERRFLDRGNPTPSNLDQDFMRFGFKLWPNVEVDDGQNRKRREMLTQLCEWRNAIAHGDISRRRAGKLVPRELDFETCREWRRALDGLVVSIDTVTARRCRVLGCSEPW